ncbi:iron uptake porin, partial [Zarconia navalis]|uniref:iron uptake porin n=1 Tax=Zarconia navalis TaxID=2992134 RepID=UPI0021F8D004
MQSLVERWGCIVGYPDSRYRGNQPLSRYEFAAGLNACLDRLADFLDDSRANVTDEDLAIVRRLQTEFAAELETLQGRVDALEARTSELEAGQFSTTTQLSGEVSFAISSAFGDRKADGEDLDSIPVFNNRVRLSFNTSFTGEDRLSTQLEALSVVPFGPGEDDEPNVTGTNMTRTAFDEGTENEVVLSKLYYAFPVSDRLHLSVDAIGGEFSETVSETYNEYFEEEFNGAISRFGRLNSIYYHGEEGTGLTLNYELNEAIDISAGYLALNASEP